MKKIMLYDPAIASTNLGDYVISDSARNQLDFIIRDSFCTDASTHLPLSWYYMRLFHDVDISFVLGSNLLKSTFLGFKRQWDISLSKIPLIKDCILVGAGWWQYENKPNLYTKILYKNVLSKKYVHSVRDQYTEKILGSLGVRSINTGCPSIWALTEDHCHMIRTEKSDSVVFTITDYNKDIKKDSEMIKILLDSYDNIFFWPQGYNDIDYLKQICSLGKFNKIQMIEPCLQAYDALLEHDVDYVGTRLHGGIRALQKKNRTVIVSIDNRAREMHQDFNIPTIDRSEIESLNHWISNNSTFDIHIPERNIIFWKDQFEK